MSVNEMLGYVTSMLYALGLMGYIQGMVIIIVVIAFWHEFRGRR